MAKVKAHLSRKKFKFWLSEKYNIDLSFTIHNYKNWFEFLQYIVITLNRFLQYIVINIDLSFYNT
jgi:hypothetical protein